MTGSALPVDAMVSVPFSELGDLRHVETDYDWLLDSVAGRVGVIEARMLIRKRVLNAIADQYPYLAAECERQQTNE